VPPVPAAGRKSDAYGRFLDPPGRAAAGRASADADRALAELAAAQHGVVSLEQARTAGLSSRAVQRRAAAGRLHRVHRGVYAVGHVRLTADGRRSAATLAAGEGSGVSHATAADQLAMVRSGSARIDVVVPTRVGRAVPGVVLHRSATLTREDVTLVGGVPTTTPARTLLDLADVLDRSRLVRAVEEADRLRLLDGRAVEDVLRRSGGRLAAAHRLRSALAELTGEPVPTRRELERRALELFDRAGLPRPRVNGLVETREAALEVDFHWPDRRLVVEADSWEFHSGRAAFEDDRRRDQLLKLAGWERVRITWRQVTRRPHEVIEAVR
jgi:predicted transcriptional regulator of viral defense system